MFDIVTVTASEANRNFSRILREVSKGKSVCVTSHGRQVAVIMPPESTAGEKARRAAAFAELKRHWASITPTTVGHWTRDELNARD